MNKFIIPTILTATVLIAGVFALMPVYEATTVHTQIGILTFLTKSSDADFDDNETLDITCTATFVVESLIIDTTNITAATDNIFLQVDPDGLGTGDDIVSISTDIQNFATSPDLNLVGAFGPFGGEAGGVIRILFDDETGGNDGNNETVTLHGVFKTGGTCS